MFSRAVPGLAVPCHAICSCVMASHDHSLPCRVRIFLKKMIPVFEKTSNIYAHGAFLWLLRARSWLRGLNNRPDPPRKTGPVPCHAMSWLHVPCQAIFLRVMPYFCVSCRVIMACRVRIFWEKYVWKNIFRILVPEFSWVQSFFRNLPPIFHG